LVINARTLQTSDKGTPLEVPLPVLFNTWKHHAGALRVRIREAAAVGVEALEELGGRMAVLGTKLMDLYTGRFWPREIALKVLAGLRAEGRLEWPAYRGWVEGQGGYALTTFPEDGSRWVLRLGDETERYIHLHPGRWSPATVRVRANVIKTAFLVLVAVAIHGGDPTDRVLINDVRGRYLGLAPLGKDLADEEGLGRIIGLLRSGDETSVTGPGVGPVTA